MRKFAAAAVGAATLAATVLGTTGTAGAATGHRVSGRSGDGAGYSARAASTGTPNRIGKIHKFAPKSIRGAAAWGNWYWAKVPGQHAFVVLNLNVKDTRADKKNAGLCYNLKTTGYPWSGLYCIVDTKGVGTFKHEQWRMDRWNNDNFEIRTAVGHLSGNTFYTSAEGPWLKVRWMA